MAVEPVEPVEPVEQGREAAAEELRGAAPAEMPPRLAPVVVEEVMVPQGQAV